MELKCAFFFLLAVLLVSQLVICVSATTQVEVSRLDIAAKYLSRNYNQTLGLIREAPILAPNNYWLASDNLLAQKALAEYYPEISSNISKTLQHYVQEFNLPTTLSGLPRSFKHEALLGENISLPFHAPSPITVRNTSDYLVKTEINNGTEMPDWTKYADLLLYASLSEYNLWTKSRAEQRYLENSQDYFRDASGMWDGIGLRDKPVVVDETASNAKYATYKLALLYYVSKLLNETLPYENELTERIIKQQQANGGFITDYRSDGSPFGDTNTETTAIILITHALRETRYRYAFVNDWDFNIPLDDTVSRKWKAVGWAREERIEGIANIANGKAKLKINTLNKTAVDTVALAQGNEPHQGINVISELLASNTELADAKEVTEVVIKKNETSSWSDYYFLYSMFQLTKRDFTATEGISSAWEIYPGYTLGFALETQHEYYDPQDGKYHLSDYWNTNMQLGSKGEPWLAAATYTDVLMVGECYNLSSQRWGVWRGPGTGQFSGDYTDTMSVQYHGLGRTTDIGVWYTLQVNLTSYWDKIFSDVQAYWNSCAQASDRSPNQYPVLTSLVLRQYALYLEGTAVDVAVDVEYVKMEDSRDEYELKENVTQLTESLSSLLNEFSFFKNLVYVLTTIAAISLITTLYYVARTKRRTVSHRQR